MERTAHASALRLAIESLRHRLPARHASWETPLEAVERFEEAVRAHSGEGQLVIGSHGMIITAWLVHRGRVQSGTAAGLFWEALAFPELIDVSLGC